MPKEYSLESIIAVDCGTVWSRALLIDVVEGRFRLIGRGEALSTIRPPNANAMLGVARALAQIETLTGRRILDNKAQLITPERPDGSGIDAFVVSASAAPPLRVFLVGLAGELSLASARRALAGAHADSVASLSPADGVNRPEGVERALERFERADADVVVIVGGIDHSGSAQNQALLEVLALAYRANIPARRPPIIYAGDVAFSDAIVSTFGELCEVQVVDNVRPTLEVENIGPLRNELQRLYGELKLQQIAGMGALAGWSRSPLLYTLQTQSYVMQYLSSHYGLNVVSLEFSASRAHVSWAVKGRAYSLAASGGVSAGASQAEEYGMEKILRWLPEAHEPADALGMLYNLSLYPGLVPGAAQEIRLTSALAREALTRLIAQARSSWSVNAHGEDPAWDLIILSGAPLTNTPTPGQAALLALDALQPIGISGLVMDALSLAPALGAIAAIEPAAAAQVLDQDGFISLGTVIAPDGRGRPGDLAVRVKIRYGDGRTLQVDVPAGALEIIPLGTGQKASLQLRAGRGFDLSGSRRGRQATVEVDGGLLGIVVDARGRPLLVPDDTAAAQAKMRQWLWEIGG